MSAENILLNYAFLKNYNNDAENVVGASSSALRVITTHSDANSIYVRKFGTDYEITDVTDIEDPVDANMKFFVYALDGTLLGSRVGGAAFIDGGTVSAQGCYLEIEASGGAVTVLATIDIDTDVDVAGLSFTCPAETISDGDTLRLYLAYSSSTYYDSGLMYGGGRHVSDSTSRFPFTTITEAIADPDATGFTICTVLDSAVYDEQFSISIANMILQAEDGETPRITSGVGARVTREVEHDGNNTDTRYVKKTGDDANPGTYQEPYLTIQYAENNMGGRAYINIMDSNTYEEALIINSDISIEPLYGIVPTITENSITTTLIELAHTGADIYGCIVDGNNLCTNLIQPTVNSYVGTVENNTVRNVAVNTGTGIGIGSASNRTGWNPIIKANLIYNIIGTDAARGVGIALQTNTGADTVNGAIEKNIIYNADAFGISINNSGPGTSIDDTTVRNNIVYLCNTGIKHSGDNFSGTNENNTITLCGIFGLSVNQITGVTGVFRNIISYNNAIDLFHNVGVAVTITESNYGTNSGFTAGGTNITTDPDFIDSANKNFALNVDSGAYRTDTSNDDMGVHFRIIEINESDIEINGFKIDGQEQYNNAIYILDSANHTGNLNKWNTIYDFQGIAGDPYDDDTDTECQYLNCIIKNNGNGIKFSYGGNTVQECLIYGNTIYGIHSDYTIQTFNHNIFFNNQYGIYFESNSNGISIKNCVFAENSLYGISSEVSIVITYCCFTDAMSSNVDTSSDTNFTNNPLFINTNSDEENFNIKTVEAEYQYDSPCKDSSDTDAFPDVGAYDIERSINNETWKKYKFAFNPQVQWGNVAKGYIRDTNADGDEDNFARSHKRRFTFDFGSRNQVSNEAIRQKMEYFASLIKTRENEITNSDKTKFRLHFQKDTFLDSGTLATIDGVNIEDTSKTWVENQWKGFWVGVIWEHGTNMVYDPVTKTGSIMGAWTDDEWIGFYTHHNDYYYYIKDNSVFKLTFSDPDETLISETADWNIEKYFRIVSNSANVLCVADPDGALVDGSFDYYIDFIEVRAYTPRFQYKQNIFLYDREYSKTGYKIIFEETDF